MKRQQAVVAARLNWWGLMKRAWPNDPDVEERVRYYTHLYAQVKLYGLAALDPHAAPAPEVTP